MPQDSLRSVVYRSFVTCDDPKGVVECKTIRKSKKMEHKIKNQRMTHSNPSYEEEDEEERKDKKVPKDSTEELQNLSSSFQIMEVSREAEKLNQVAIDSWCNVDKQSKYIAKDLLRGALDLQESLVMLSKLQQAPKYKEKAVGGREVDVGNGGYDNQGMELEKPRVSRDCYDELRDVIRESFSRRNLLPKVSAKEKDYVERKSSDWCMDFPSSSSSQSSLIHSQSCECSPLSSVQHEKPKGPNLIAKLMGLEEVPSKAVFKQMEKEKLLNQRSYLLDMDLPRPKKPQFVVQKVVRERRTLEEMIETMEFKGLVEGKDSIDGKYRCDHVSLLRKSLAAEDPPIVLMRPLRVPHQNHWINEEKHIKSRKMPFPPCAVEVPGGELRFKDRNEKLTARRLPKQKLNKDNEDNKRSRKFPEKKTLDTQDRVSTMKINHSKPLVPRMQRKGVVRKIDDKQKVAPDTRKREEMKDAKSRESSRTQDVGKVTTLKLSKAVTESNVSKSQIARAKVVATDEKMKQTSLKSSIPKKNLRKGKPNSKPSAALVVENRQSDDNLPINIESNIQGSLMKSTASEQITEEVMNASCVSISDDSGNAESSPSEPIRKNDLSGIEDDSCIPSRYLDETKGCKSITNTRCLLLSSVSFLNHVEELFDTRTCDSMVFPTDCLPDSEVLDDPLLLDCAKEILERKSLCCTRMINPFSQKLSGKPKCKVSIQELVGEISDGIEYLRNYSKSCGDIVVVDSVYSMLQRDLWWNEEVTGTWDLGWRNGYTTEAVNEVVHDIEKLVLSEFIGDVVTELMAQ